MVNSQERLEDLNNYSVCNMTTSQGNRFSSKNKKPEPGHRHIYIGEIQEIEEEEPVWARRSSRFKHAAPGISRIPEESEDSAGPSKHGERDIEEAAHPQTTEDGVPVPPKT